MRLLVWAGAARGTVEGLDGDGKCMQVHAHAHGVSARIAHIPLVSCVCAVRPQDPCRQLHALGVHPQRSACRGAMPWHGAACNTSIVAFLMAAPHQRRGYTRACMSACTQQRQPHRQCPNRPLTLSPPPRPCASCPVCLPPLRCTRTCARSTPRSGSARSASTWR